jgi:hypothetical protein
MTLSSALLRAVRIGGMGMSAGGMVMGGGYDMGGSGGVTGIGFIDSALDWVLNQPSWLSALIFTTVTVLVAFIAGKIIGRIYISIRYPNPDKPQYLSPKQKLIVLAAGAVILVSLMGAFMKEEASELPVDGSMDMDPGMMDPGMMEPGVMEPLEGEDIDEGEPTPEDDMAAEEDTEDAPSADAARPAVTAPAGRGPAVSVMPATKLA